MKRKHQKTVNERIADADARGSTWLAKANDLAEAGKKKEAEHCYRKGQYWLDRSNIQTSAWCHVLRKAPDSDC